MKNNRLVLPLIIFLLIIFLPVAVLGVSNKVYHAIIGENPHHLHKIDNRLYYYNDQGSFIGYYDCQNVSCDDARSTIDDKDFYYYQEATDDALGVFSEEYVFIQDGDDIVLYNLKINKDLFHYQTMKTYGSIIAQAYVILGDSQGRYHVYDTYSKTTLSTTYDFIGASDSMMNMTPNGLILAVKSGEDWDLIRPDGESLGLNLSGGQVYNYDDNCVYLKKDGHYFLLNYNNEKVLDTTVIDDIAWKNGFIILTNSFGDIIIYDSSLFNDPVETFVNTSDGLKYDFNGDKIIVKNSNGTEVGSFELKKEVIVE